MNPWLKKNDLSQAYGKWKKFWFDRGLHSPYHSDMQLTVALERQRLYNETLPDGCARFKRLSIPILFRLLRECEAITGVSKSSGRTGCYPTSQHMTFKFMTDEIVADIRCLNNLDAESELMLILVHEMKHKIVEHGHILFHSLTYVPESRSLDEYFFPKPDIILNFRDQDA